MCITDIFLHRCTTLNPCLNFRQAPAHRPPGQKNSFWKIGDAVNAGFAQARQLANCFDTNQFVGLGGVYSRACTMGFWGCAGLVRGWVLRGVWLHRVLQLVAEVRSSNLKAKCKNWCPGTLTFTPIPLLFLAYLLCNVRQHTQSRLIQPPLISIVQYLLANPLKSLQVSQLGQIFVAQLLPQRLKTLF